MNGSAPIDGIDKETRSDALDVLAYVVDWHLTPERWNAVRATVRELTEAVTQCNNDAARSALTDLDLLGPVRATQFGSLPKTPASEPVREEIEELVHTLGDNSPPPQNLSSRTSEDT